MFSAYIQINEWPPLTSLNISGRDQLAEETLIPRGVVIHQLNYYWPFTNINEVHRTALAKHLFIIILRAINEYLLQFYAIVKLLFCVIDNYV